MALASLFGGMALANARLGAVHGMANPVGGFSYAPHGAVCARLLPLVIETNLHALRNRLPGSPAIARYTEVARLLTGMKLPCRRWRGVGAGAMQRSGYPTPEKYGLNPDDLPAVVEQSQKANSMKGNPVNLTDNELLTILESALAT